MSSVFWKTKWTCPFLKGETIFTCKGNLMLYKHLWTDWLEQTLSKDVQKYKKSMENYISTLPRSWPLTANNCKAVLLHKGGHCKSPNSKRCLMFVIKTSWEYKLAHTSPAKYFKLRWKFIAPNSVTCIFFEYSLLNQKI